MSSIVFRSPLSSIARIRACRCAALQTRLGVLVCFRLLPLYCIFIFYPWHLGLHYSRCPKALVSPEPAPPK